MERHPTPVNREAPTPAGGDGAPAAEPPGLADLLRVQGLPVPAEPPATTGAPGAVDRIADWARSGLMWLTGRPDGPPLAPTGPVLARARASVGVLNAFGPWPGEPAAGRPLLESLPVELALGGRAALLGLTRHGAVSANGTARLTRCTDGWVALNLARPDDADLVGALLERDLGRPDADRPTAGAAIEAAWAAFASAAPGRRSADLVDRARLLGLPAAAVPPRPAGAAVPGPPGRGQLCVTVRPLGRPRPGRPLPRPFVLDLSALWAGPLCARLLGDAGLRVVKLESVGRPDGARAGDQTFYTWLHAGQASVAVDFTSRAGRSALAALVARADVVIESTRPRALAQLGIDAPTVVAARPGVTWVSITGYGRDSGDGPGAVAFGDDAAVAGGLVAWAGPATGRPGAAGGRPVFCGDAIADPLTGLYAAAAARASVAAGGGHLLEVSMAAVAAHANASGPVGPAPEPAARPGADGRWWVAVGTERVAVAPPRPPSPAGWGTAAPLGADTRAVLAEIGAPG